MQRGLFGCAPIHPTLAVSMKLLRFAQLHFLHVAPNRTGFVHALHCFLSELSYTLPNSVGESLRTVIFIALTRF